MVGFTFPVAWQRPSIQIRFMRYDINLADRQKLKEKMICF